jgi:hypothetical protein
MTDEE